MMNLLGDGYTRQFTYPEARLLLQIYSDPQTQHELRAMSRNKPVWEKIATILRQRGGFDRTADQCKNKINNLKNGYRRVRMEIDRGAPAAIRLNCPFFSELEAIANEIPITEEFPERNHENAKLFPDDEDGDWEESGGKTNSDEETTNENELKPQLAPTMLQRFMQSNGRSEEHNEEFLDQQQGARSSVVGPTSTSSGTAYVEPTPVDDDMPIPIGLRYGIKRKASAGIPTCGDFATIQNSSNHTNSNHTNINHTNSYHTNSNHTVCSANGSGVHEFNSIMSNAIEQFAKIQSETMRRFVEIEEKRLRWEMEMENRRREAEREDAERRERFFMQLMQMVAGVGQNRDKVSPSNKSEKD